MSDTNGFGYVKIENGLVVCYTGDSRTPTVHKFENDEIVNSVKLQELVKEIIPKVLFITECLDDFESGNRIKELLQSLVEQASQESEK